MQIINCAYTMEGSFDMNYTSALSSKLQSVISDEPDLQLFIVDDSKINQLNNISLNLLSSTEINQVINNETLTLEEKKVQLDEILKNTIPADSYIAAVDVASIQGTVFRYGNEQIGSVATNQEFIDNLSNMQLYIDNNCRMSKGGYYLPIGKKINNYSTGTDIGYLIFYVDESALGSSYSEFVTSKNIFSISVDDVIVSHPEKKYINSLLYMPVEMFNDRLKNNRDHSGYVVYENRIEEPSVVNSVKITGIISNHFLFSTMNRITTIILMVFIAILLFSVTFALAFSKNLMYHIAALNKNMARFANDHTEPPAVQGKNEILELEESFKKMTLQITELISKIEKEKEKQKITEINFLQAQINPHFIYNALDAIGWKAKINKQFEIDEMIINLATFLRVGLHKGENIISVADELRHVESYLKIEKSRFVDLFDVEFELEDGILNKSVVKVILQPVVENCIIHGFKNMDKKGVITIRAYSDNEDIIFEIEDNGCGMELPPDGGFPKSQNKSGGYGLYNVNKRLQMYYGEGYGLSFVSVPGKGTLVKIRAKNKQEEREA